MQNKLIELRTGFYMPSKKHRTHPRTDIDWCDPGACFNDGPNDRSSTLLYTGCPKKTQQKKYHTITCI